MATQTPTRHAFSSLVRTTAAACALISIGLASSVGAAEPQYDVCRTQLERFVADRFGQSVTKIKFHYDYEESRYHYPPKTDAVVYTAECPGYHYFEVNATYMTCKNLPHYGQPPTYIHYRSSADGCSAPTG